MSKESYPGKSAAYQILAKADSQKAFELNLMDDLPDFASMEIVTDEPGHKEYVILLSEVMRSLML